ncbi:MAG: ABC transporter substrate-binding protein [Chloroflexi bacterium]|nr:ABC transporter substrate-binding protein [Chloroflexota bacterium]
MPGLDLDALKKTPDTLEPPRRVVSLVPSMTESLFALGFGASVVGVTEYCIHPAGRVAGLPKVGGTKNPDIEKIKELGPDLVMANQEENTPQAVQALLDAGLRVWVTFPQTVNQTINDLRALLAIYHTDKPALHINSLQMALDWARAASFEQPRIRYFCPIWQQGEGPDTWWMTFNRHTYTDSLLAVFGGENIFADREKREPLAADLGRGQGQPAEGDRRYPRVSQEEVIEAAPELIILPSEPFAFTAQHLRDIRNLLAFTPAAKAGRLRLVDGTLLTWPGARLGSALQELPALFLS